MAYYAKDELLKMAVDLTDSAVSGEGSVVKRPEDVAAFIQVVYDKLVEINEGID